MSPSNLPSQQAVLEQVVELVRAAGDLTLRWFRSAELDVDHKADGTPVTEADRAAERYLREGLARLFPDDAVIGEEEPDTTGSSGCTWIIDPIDGTKAFTHGVPLYSTLVARYDEAGCALGVINLPALGETLYAGRGLGCRLRRADGAVLDARVSARSTLAGGCVCTSGLGGWDRAHLDRLLGSGALVRTWGDGFGFALVATGRVEAMVDPEVALWDVAPLPVILTEAGGRFTDAAGAASPAALDPGRTHAAVATNGLVHDEVLRLLGT